MLDNLVNQVLPDVSSNARLVDHRCGPTVLQVSNSNLFRASGWESQRPYDVPSKGCGKDPERAMISSRNRAKREVRNLVYNNRFLCFFTGTLDPSRIDRYDADAVKVKLQYWLRNKSARNGLSYVLVAERHIDGAIHFHGLINPGTLSLVPAVNPHTGAPIFRAPGQQVYNLPGWTFGHSTAIFIDDNYERTCNYLLKYFTKDYEKIFGKWYFSSRNLVRNPEIQLIDGGINYASFVNDNPDAGIVPVFNDVCIACKTFSSNISKGGSV